MCKLRHKGTGEIISSKELLTDEFITDLFSKDFNYFHSKLEKIFDVWEVYEEPTYWYIYADHVFENKCDGVMEDMFKANGNYFKTKEEAEKAVEKLKAWKRLKDNSFRFVDLRFEYDELGGTIKFKTNLYDGINDDLDLLFGGEE